MTSKCHWMPFYPCDYLGDTGHLSTLEHGAYLLLIMHYWMKGGLPDNERQLARICRLPDYRWRKIRDTIAGLFHDGWKHKRIDEELAKAEAVRAKKSAAGKVSSAARRANPLKNNEAVLTPVDTSTITVTKIKTEARQADPKGSAGARFSVAELPTFKVPTVPASGWTLEETRQDALLGALAGLPAVVDNPIQISAALLASPLTRKMPARNGAANGQG